MNNIINFMTWELIDLKIDCLRNNWSNIIFSPSIKYKMNNQNFSQDFPVACCLLELRPRKLIYTRPAAYISIYAAVCLSVCLSVHIFVCQSSRKVALSAAPPWLSSRGAYTPWLWTNVCLLKYLLIIQIHVSCLSFQ